jgi:hypothetical protein
VEYARALLRFGSEFGRLTRLGIAPFFDTDIGAELILLQSSFHGVALAC